MNPILIVIVVLLVVGVLAGTIISSLKLARRADRLTATRPTPRPNADVDDED